LREDRMVYRDPIVTEFGNAENYKKFVESYAQEDDLKIAKYVVW